MTCRAVKMDTGRMWPSVPLPKHQAVLRLASGLYSLWSVGSDHRRFLWFLFGFRLLGNIFSACTARSYDRLGFKYPSPEHNLEAFRSNYKPMRLQLSALKMSTSAPFVCNDEGLGTVHTEWTFECLKNQNYGPSGKEPNCPSLKKYLLSENC